MRQDQESFQPQKELLSLERDFSRDCLQRLVQTTYHAAQDYYASTDSAIARFPTAEEYGMQMLRLVVGASYELQRARPVSMTQGQIEDLMCRAVHNVTRSASSFRRDGPESKTFEVHVADYVHFQLSLAMKILRCREGL